MFSSIHLLEGFQPGFGGNLDVSVLDKDHGDKAEKYEEIKYLVNERTDLNAYALIKRIIDIIGEDKDEV